MKGNGKKKYNAEKIFAILWLILLLVVFTLIEKTSYIADLNIWVSFFVTANIVSFVVYALDKMLAVSKSVRIPESILYISAIAGGPLGAIVAMYLFRHKTKKLSFQIVLALIMLVQLFIVYLLIK